MKAPNGNSAAAGVENRTRPSAASVWIFNASREALNTDYAERWLINDPIDGPHGRSYEPVRTSARK